MSEPRSVSTLPTIALGLVLAISVLVIHARVVLGGKTWDDVAYHTEIAPPRLAAAEAIAAGELPGWWEASGLGVPLLGEPSHGAAYPLAWIATTPHALDLLWILHVLWLALGVALWSRRLGASELTSVLAGVIVAASGIVGSAAIRGVLPALAHVPWVAWAALGLRKADTARSRVRATAALAAALGMIGLAGHLAILVDASALALLVGWRRGRLGALATGVGAGVAIAMVQWIPALLVIADGAGAEVGALRPSRLVELIAPGSFGAGSSDRAVAQIAGEHPAWPSLYIGAPLLALALVARGSRRTTGYVVALVALTAVAGRGGWPAWLGAPELHLALVVLVAAAHASLGLDALLAGQRRALLALGGGALATAVATGALVVLGARVGAPALDRAVIDGVLAVLCIAGAVAVAWRTRLRFVTAALVVAPTVGALGATAPLIDRSIVETTPMWADAASTVPTEGAPRRVYRPLSLFEDESPTSVTDAIATLVGTSAARHGLGSARSEDPARPPIHDAVWLAASSVGGALLERYAISIAILPIAMVDGRKLAELARRASWSLVRYPTAPAAAIVTEWIWLPDDATAIARLFPPGVGRGLPAGLVVLRGRGADHQDEPAEPEPCTVTRWSRGVIDLTCVANAPAYAVVSSTSAPGWTVHVAGVDTPWVTADVLRRAVEIPAGASVVSWRYEPPGLLGGVVVGLAGVLAVVGYAVAVSLLTRRRTRDRASRETS